MMENPVMTHYPIWMTIVPLISIGMDISAKYIPDGTEVYKKTGQTKFF